MIDSELHAELRAIVGREHVLTDAEMRAGYERDWTGRFGGEAAAVVRPADVEQVASVLRACAEAQAPIVPQGGNTGLVGAGVPRGGEILLSLSRLDDVGEVHAADGTVEAGAGATLHAVQARAAQSGRLFGVDFGARDSATVGGMVATDAGGLRAMRHGTMRAQVAGLEAVLADGAIIRRMTPVLKDNAGFDLPALLIGSEGTLGVITRARLQTRYAPRARVVCLLALESLDAAVALLGTLRSHAPSLEAADFFLDDGLAMAADYLRATPPTACRTPAYVIAELAADSDPTDELAAALEHATGIADAVVADDTARRAALWRFREAIPEAIAAAGVPHKLDVGVPIDRLPDFIDGLHRDLGRFRPQAQAVCFGHLGDGNVHVNVLGAAADDTELDELILRQAVDCGGTISAEHGVGIAKAGWLALMRSPQDLAAMAAVKTALDPDWRLNPGAVLALP